MQGVDPDVARLQPLRRAPRFAEILGPDRRTQPILRAIGFLDSLVQILDLEDRKQWAKSFLRHDARIVRRAGHHRWEVEKPFFELRAFRTLAADENLCSSIHSVLSLRFDFFPLRFCVHGTKPRVLIQSVAEFQALDLSHKLLDKLIVNTLDDIQPFHGKAGLSAVVEPSDRSPSECFVNVGIFADNHWITPAKLQGHALHPAAGHFHDVLAGLTLTGKCDAGHLGIAQNFFADYAAGTYYDVEHTLRQSRPIQYFDDANGGQRRC